MNAEQLQSAATLLFQQALAKVESDSIRQWAETEHNRPIWIKAAEAAIVKHNGQPNVALFTVLIVSSAIGL